MLCNKLFDGQYFPEFISFLENSNGSMEKEAITDKGGRGEG